MPLPDAHPQVCAHEQRKPLIFSSLVSKEAQKRGSVAKVPEKRVTTKETRDSVTGRFKDRTVVRQ